MLSEAVAQKHVSHSWVKEALSFAPLARRGNALAAGEQTGCRLAFLDQRLSELSKGL